MSPRAVAAVGAGAAGAARPGRAGLILGPFIAGSVIAAAAVYLLAWFDPGPAAFPHLTSAGDLPRYLWVSLPDAAFGNWAELLGLLAAIYVPCYFAGGLVHYWRAARRRREGPVTGWAGQEEASPYPQPGQLQGAPYGPGPVAEPPGAAGWPAWPYGQAGLGGPDDIPRGGARDPGPARAPGAGTHREAGAR